MPVALRTFFVKGLHPRHAVLSKMESPPPEWLIYVMENRMAIMYNPLRFVGIKGGFLKMLLKAALFFHIISAIFWIGGMLFLTLVIVPFLQTIQDKEAKSKIYQTVGKKYRLYGWVAITTLLVTGPVILFTIYGITPSDVFSPMFHATRFGKTLSIKLGLVALVVVSSLVHDFWLGPQARISPRFSFLARIFGRGNLIIALLIVIFAVFLRAGGM